MVRESAWQLRRLRCCYSISSFYFEKIVKINSPTDQLISAISANRRRRKYVGILIEMYRYALETAFFEFIKIEQRSFEIFSFNAQLFYRSLLIKCPHVIGYEFFRRK